MPHFDIVKVTRPNDSFRVASIRGTFDLQDAQIKEHFVGDIDLPNDWQIGMIVGNSGTGKTTIAKNLFPDAYFEKFDYTHDNVLDDMPETASCYDITKTFSNVGFASVPSWLKPYSVLSNGEKMRVDLARCLLSDKDLFVFDEFTSVVDRNIAKIGAWATQKAIRKNGNKKFIAVSCHFDIEDWLLPDWVFDTNSMTFRLCEGQKKNRPKCKLEIYETKQKEYYWNIFRKHHYLNHSINKAARVFVATLNGNLCAFTSVLLFPHPVKKNVWREHRTVVLPDFQGLGISMKMCLFLCELLKKQGKKYIITTSNPARISGLKNNKYFRCTRIGRAAKGGKNGKIQNRYKKGSTSSSRITASFEYIG